MISMHSYNNIMFSFDLQVITYVVGIYTRCDVRTVYDARFTTLCGVPTYDFTGITFNIIYSDRYI